MAEDDPLSGTIDSRYFGGFVGDYANTFLAPFVERGLLGENAQAEKRRLHDMVMFVTKQIKQKPDFAANNLYFGFATMYRGSPFSYRLEECLKRNPSFLPIVERAREISRAQAFDFTTGFVKRALGNQVVIQAITARKRLLPKTITKTASRRFTFSLANGALASYGASLRIAKRR